MTLEEQIIAELAGIRAAIKAIAVRVSVLSEMGEADLRQMNEAATGCLPSFPSPHREPTGQPFEGAPKG